MREILFRGKRLQGGDWVEGYFFKSSLYNIFVDEMFGGVLSA